MFGILRAGGFAAAALALVFSAAFAAPSVAGEVQVQRPAAHYSEHAAASIDGGSFAAEATGGARLAHDVDFSTPVVEHAIAPVAEVAEAPVENPATAKVKSLGAMVDAYAHAAEIDAEMACLAGAVYFESKGEPLEGQLAVAEVVINRSKSGRFPSSLCGVVKQKSQFSFVRGGRIPSIPDNAAWRKAVAIAHIAQQDLAHSAGSKALFFHATYVRPGWRGLTRVASLGNHIFYR